MSEYVRPPQPKQVFYDAAGAVIDYGNRWRGQPPPEDTYSVVSNPERFAPLHSVADALIDHLRSTYAVSVSENIAFAGDLMQELAGVARAVRAVPDIADAAPLTFVFTSYPGVIVHAGLLHDFPFPQCGCDACDESVEILAEEMECLVFAVVDGRYSETVTAGFGPRIGYQITSADGSRLRSGDDLSATFPTDGMRAAGRRLGRMPHGWQPWEPLRLRG
jgi:hypothetical protein